MLLIIFSPNPEKDFLEIWEHNGQYDWIANISGVIFFQITLGAGWDFVSLMEIMETYRSMTSKTTSRTCFTGRGLVWIFCSQIYIAAFSPVGAMNRIALLPRTACFNEALQDSWLRHLYSFHLICLKLI